MLCSSAAISFTTSPFLEGRISLYASIIYYQLVVRLASDEWTTITIRRTTKKKLERVAKELAEPFGEKAKLSMDFTINYLIKLYDEQKGKEAAPMIEAA